MTNLIDTLYPLPDIRRRGDARERQRVVRPHAEQDAMKRVSASGDPSFVGSTLRLDDARHVEYAEEIADRRRRRHARRVRLARQDHVRAGPAAHRALL